MSEPFYRKDLSLVRVTTMVMMMVMVWRPSECENVTSCHPKYGGRCLIANRTPLTWSVAKQWCDDLFNSTGQHYRQIVVDSADRQRELTSFIDDSDLNAYTTWLGATRQNSSRWTWIDDTEYSPGYSPDSPQVANYSFAFIIARNVSTIGLAMPREVKKFICVLPVTDNCSQSTSYQRHSNGKCYFVEGDNADSRHWPSARNRCLNLGGDLVTYNEIQDLKNLSLSTGTDYWIGIQKGAFTWNDGGNSAMNYTNFMGDRPYVSPTNCIGIVSGSGYAWESQDCSVQQYSVCESVDPMHSVTSTSVTLAVTDQPLSATTNPLALQSVGQQNTFLSSGAVAGICVGCTILSIIVGILIGYFYRKHRADTATTGVTRTRIELPPPLVSRTSHQPDLLDVNVARSQRIEVKGSINSIYNALYYSAPVVDRAADNGDDDDRSEPYYNSVRDNNSSAFYVNVSDSLNPIADGAHQYTDGGSRLTVVPDDGLLYTDVVGLW